MKKALISAAATALSVFIFWYGGVNFLERDPINALFLTFSLWAGGATYSLISLISLKATA